MRLALLPILDRLAASGPRAEAARTSAAGYPPPASSLAWSLLVGHDGVFKVVLLALLDLPLERFWSFGFGLTGITIVGIHDGLAVLRAHNLQDHLGPLQDLEPPGADSDDDAAYAPTEPSAIAAPPDETCNTAAAVSDGKMVFTNATAAR